MEIGATIKHLRQEKGIKQVELANQSQISQTYLSQIEKGLKTPKLDVLEKISKVLNIPLPILSFLSLDKDMIAEEKRELYDKMMPPVKNIVKELFM